MQEHDPPGVLNPGGSVGPALGGQGGGSADQALDYVHWSRAGAVRFTGFAPVLVAKSWHPSNPLGGSAAWLRKNFLFRGTRLVTIYGPGARGFHHGREVAHTALFSGKVGTGFP